jgi:dTDP-4-dehydrorhamnose 3,5-epimerase
MNIKHTIFDKVFELEYNSFKDNRGEFVKTIHKESFLEKGLEWTFEESFFSVSSKNVFRGMHFQYPPYDHDKLVYVVNGSIIDVVLDLRKESATYGQHLTIELSQENRKALHIGKGFAHGFFSMEEDTVVEYHTTTMQSKEFEGGIKWDSFGLQLPISLPILSVRDSSFDPFNFQKKYF